MQSNFKTENPRVGSSIDSNRLRAILAPSGRTACVLIRFANRSAPGHHIRSVQSERSSQLPARFQVGGSARRSVISPDARGRALDCLSRFGERLRDIHAHRVRAAGTSTIRRAHEDTGFMGEAEEALGHPIEIVSGLEEARLIYKGVTHSLPPTDGLRLVMDIGGGSTELILGQGPTPRALESLHLGCVSMTERFFPDGRMVVSTHGGDIWIISGIDGDLSDLRWKRHAAGLYEPFGLQVIDGLVYVTCKDRLTRLHDYNGDGEADFYESFSADDDVSIWFHAFNFDLQRDSEGNLYYAKAGQYTSYKLPGSIIKVSATGKDMVGA